MLAIRSAAARRRPNKSAGNQPVLVLWRKLMSLKQYVGRSLVATGISIALVAGAVNAQQKAKEFEPQVGQVKRHVGAGRAPAYAVDVHHALDGRHHPLAGRVDQLDAHLVPPELVYLEPYPRGHAQERVRRRELPGRDRVEGAYHRELPEHVLGVVAEREHLYLHTDGITVRARPGNTPLSGYMLWP